MKSEPRKNRMQIDPDANDAAEKIYSDNSPEVGGFFVTINPTSIACNRLSGACRRHSRGKKDGPEDEVDKLRV
jgi:hypothetical protein